MTKTASLHIRVDPAVKSQIEELFSDFGITITDAVNIFFHQALMEQGLPFELRRRNVTFAAMQEALDIEAGLIPSKAYKSAKELSEELDSES